MNEIIKEDNIENKIYEIRGVQVMLDSDLAELYQCKYGTKDVNRAVKNNLDKFPKRFSWILTDEEKENLQLNFLTANISNKSRSNPRVFTEQGIYMLGTILKSNVATKVSISIMDTFVKMRHYINFNKNILPNRVMLLEDKVDENTKRINELFDKFDPKDITKDLVVFNNELFKAYYVIEKIFESAKKEIIIIDNYADKELLKEISKYNKKCIIISKNMDSKLVNKYNKQFNNVEFIYSDVFHDRFIIIDKKTIYHCGASLKDLGKKCSSIYNMKDNFILKELEII